MKRKRLTALLLAALLISLTGCQSAGGSGGSDGKASGDGETADTSDASGGSSSSDSSSEAALPQTDEDMFTDRDMDADYDESSSVRIELNGTSISASSDSVDISGTTITITEEACYIITGTLDDGMIIVDAPDTAKLQLVFDGVDITSGTSAPLYILEADKVFVTLADGTENTLSNGGTFTAIDDNNIDSVIFSKQDLTLNGSGSLTVTSPAGHGIVSKDDLVITGGSYEITAASHGLQANDSVRITGDTSLVVDAGKDGIHAENDEDTSLGFVYISDGTFDIASEGDGISAGAWLQIGDGTFSILAGGGSANSTKESSDDWGSFGGGGAPGGGRPGDAEGTAPGSGGGRSGGDCTGGKQTDGEQTSGQQLSMSASAADETYTKEMTTESDSSSAETSDNTSEDSSTSMKGMKSQSDMLITGGSITIDSADDSVHSNASITVNGGTFDIAAGDDAFHADDTLTVTDGTINISESYEGLEALHVDVQGGDITLTASDDGLNAAGGTDSSGTEGGRDGMFGGGPGGGGGMSSTSDGTITISGGNLYINASGDGIDANGSLTISGGYTVVVGPTQGDTSTLDYDTEAVITGGTFIGTGASGMAQTFSSSEQGVVAVSVGTQEAGTEVSLSDADGNVLISCTPELSYAVVILSSPDLVSGETYTLTAGSASGDVEAE